MDRIKQGEEQNGRGVENRTPQADQFFQNPDSRFRGAPFWAWNGKLEKEQLIRQIGFFKEMGMGGFHMHSRIGLDTPYMEDEFMEMVRLCVDEAKKEGMYAYLYDEDRWPSGTAGGKVTKNEQYRSRYLVMTRVPNEKRRDKRDILDSSAVANVRGNGKLLAAYRICMEDGYLKEYERLDISGELPDDCWYVYLETASESPWYNNQTYVDTLNPEAISEFIRQTHEKYADLLQDEFGGCVPSIFTDEPQFTRKMVPERAEEQKDITMPYTESFELRYEKEYGESFFDRLPEIIWELPDGRKNTVRYRYHELLSEQFAEAFADTVGSWCEKHGIALTGHMMEEPTLRSQTAALGEAMRSYRSFQMPGIDMLCDWREYNTAKQAQSAAHQYGREGVASELYGVTNWDFDFRRHKLQGDWQAALGVTRRVHHLAWMTMAGEAKRDYPASIFYQSPWYREYRLLEDHYARLNTVLTDGKPVVKVGVIHPIESYWMHFGPEGQTRAFREEMEKHFSELTEWLLFTHMDFDFIAESLLPDLYQPKKEPCFSVGEMDYDVVIVPSCETLRSTTMDALEYFAQNGGKVIVLGKLPVCLDGMLDERAEKTAQLAACIPFEKSALMEQLEPFRIVNVCNTAGEQAESRVTQLRSIGSDYWLFAANGREQRNPDIPWKELLEIGIKGSYHVALYDTLDGSVTPLPVTLKDGSSFVKVDAWEHDSVLLRFRPAEEYQEQEGVGKAAGYDGTNVCEGGIYRKNAGETISAANVCQPSAFRLFESNTLLLDTASWRLDGGEWEEEQDILRVDNEIRERLGYHKRTDMTAQPWTFEKEEPSHLVELKFIVESETEAEDVRLALEYKDGWEIAVNGQKIELRDEGYFTDECIRKFPLPAIGRGQTEIVVKIPFGRLTNLEWCYLLGSFGVKTAGNHSILTEMPDKLYFGDYAAQGFPFYTGNMEYEVETETCEGDYVLEITRFRAPLLRVCVDGRDCGTVMLAPYEVDLGHLEAGKHTISVLSYGNRFNAFGAVHNCNEQECWAGPYAWRTTGAFYSGEYQLKKMGILKAPVLKRRK